MSHPNPHIAQTNAYLNFVHMLQRLPEAPVIERHLMREGSTFSNPVPAHATRVTFVPTSTAFVGGRTSPTTTTAISPTPTIGNSVHSARLEKLRITQLEPLLRDIGCDVGDCVTANDYAVRLHEVLDRQFDLEAALSTERADPRSRVNATDRVMRLLNAADGGAASLEDANRAITLLRDHNAELQGQVNRLRGMRPALAKALSALRELRQELEELRSSVRFSVYEGTEAVRESARELSVLTGENVTAPFVGRSREAETAESIGKMKLNHKLRDGASVLRSMIDLVMQEAAASIYVGTDNGVGELLAPLAAAPTPTGAAGSQSSNIAPMEAENGSVASPLTHVSSSSTLLSVRQPSFSATQSSRAGVVGVPINELIREMADDPYNRRVARLTADWEPLRLLKKMPDVAAPVLESVTKLAMRLHQVGELVQWLAEARAGLLSEIEAATAHQEAGTPQLLRSDESRRGHKESGGGDLPAEQGVTPRVTSGKQRNGAGVITASPSTGVAGQNKSKNPRVEAKDAATKKPQTVTSENGGSRSGAGEKQSAGRVPTGATTQERKVEVRERLLRPAPSLTSPSLPPEHQRANKFVQTDQSAQLAIDPPPPVTCSARGSTPSPRQVLPSVQPTSKTVFVDPLADGFTDDERQRVGDLLTDLVELLQSTPSSGAEDSSEAERDAALVSRIKAVLIGDDPPCSDDEAFSPLSTADDGVHVISVADGAQHLSGSESLGNARGAHPLPPRRSSESEIAVVSSDSLPLSSSSAGGGNTTTLSRATSGVSTLRKRHSSLATLLPAALLHQTSAPQVEAAQQLSTVSAAADPPGPYFALPIKQPEPELVLPSYMTAGAGLPSPFSTPSPLSTTAKRRAKGLSTLSPNASANAEAIRGASSDGLESMMPMAQLLMQRDRRNIRPRSLPLLDSASGGTAESRNESGGDLEALRAALRSMPDIMMGSPGQQLRSRAYRHPLSGPGDVNLPSDAGTSAQLMFSSECALPTPARSTTLRQL